MKEEFIYSSHNEDVSSDSDSSSEAEGPVFPKLNNKNEIEDTLRRAFTNGHPIEVTALEINGVKFSGNCTFQDVLDVMIPETFKLIKPDASDWKTIMVRWGPLWKKFTHGQEDMTHMLWVITVSGCIPISSSRILISIICSAHSLTKPIRHLRYPLRKPYTLALQRGDLD